MNIRQLASRKLPDDLNDAPIFAPADIVFRAGSTVRVDVDFGRDDRTAQAKAQYEKVLKRDGFLVGDGGWVLRCSLKEAATTERITTRGGLKVVVPNVVASGELRGPDTRGVILPAMHGTIDAARTRFQVGDHYDFGTRDPARTMADECWSRVMTDLHLNIKYPHILVSLNGRLESLPRFVEQKP